MQAGKLATVLQAIPEWNCQFFLTQWQLATAYSVSNNDSPMYRQMTAEISVQPSKSME